MSTCAQDSFSVCQSQLLFLLSLVGFIGQKSAIDVSEIVFLWNIPSIHMVNSGMAFPGFLTLRETEFPYLTHSQDFTLPSLYLGIPERKCCL